MAQFGGSNTIRFAERKATSPAFHKLYREGMGLVEETAAYLDGPGRDDAKALSRGAAALYAAESMRLTTRLMQLASWLLLQRALNSGEMTKEQVASEKGKIRLDTQSANKDIATWAELPLAFADLVRRSLQLQTQIKMMDAELFGGQDKVSDAAVRENPVTSQINLLKTAFGA